MLRRVTVLRYELGFKSGIVTVWYIMLIVTTWSTDIYNYFIMCLQHGQLLFVTIYNYVIMCLQHGQVIFTTILTQAQTVQHCHALFDDQLVRLYTRKVYLKYR
jgi:hypothetical protein